MWVLAAEVTAVRWRLSYLSYHHHHQVFLEACFLSVLLGWILILGFLTLLVPALGFSCHNTLCVSVSVAHPVLGMRALRLPASALLSGVLGLWVFLPAIELRMTLNSWDLYTTSASMCQIDSSLSTVPLTFKRHYICVEGVHTCHFTLVEKRPNGILWEVLSSSYMGSKGWTQALWFAF